MADHPLGAEGLEWANYRPADGDERCGNCSFFEAGHCRMFKTTVDPDYVCDEWQPETSTSTRGGDIMEHDSQDAGAELRFVVAPITHIDVRDPSGNDDGTWTMSGYAAVFNQATVLYDGKFVRISESIDPAAFDYVLREQPMSRPDGVVHFNLGHDMNRAVAATDVAPAGTAGSLQLSADAHGLRFLAKVPKDDPDGLAMAVKMRTGVLRQASFAFTVRKAEWTDTENADGPDESHRRLIELEHLYDVCACPQGAYSQAESGLRTYARSLGFQFGQPALEDLEHHAGGHPRQPDPSGGAIPVSPGSGGGKSQARHLPRQLQRRISSLKPAA